ncbi:MAG: hypothetical protein JNK82_01495 [Myxococcaceae bacterium]|nr:hypothetical protein [Myxococcaceae bacterium]
MSLALFRERIEAGDVDETVRAHLRGCHECRAHYDLLARTARALGDDGAARERERLFAALPKDAERKPPPRIGWLAAVAALLLAVATALALRPRENPDVMLRGGEDPGAEAPFSLRVYGKDAPGQPVRLIADFPGSKEASVGVRSELQYFVKPGTTRLLVESRGANRTLPASSDGSAVDLSPVGKAFSVGAFGPGNVEVCAAVAPPGITTLADAVKAGAVRHCSTLVVTP